MMPLVLTELRVASRVVTLTFDDGPHMERTPRVLKALGQAKIKAAFFVLGSRMQRRAQIEIVERIVEAGHSIGNHSFSHPDLTKLDSRSVRKEVLRTEERIRDYLGPTKLFRPPYGARNTVVDSVVRDLGYKMVLWDVDSEDYRSDLGESWIQRTVRATAESITVREHTVILCHDAKLITAEGIGTLIDHLRRLKGVTLDGSDLMLERAS
jgi:peptidoglycan-N-acetylglucosamine deacetylase